MITSGLSVKVLSYLKQKQRIDKIMIEEEERHKAAIQTFLHSKLCPPCGLGVRYSALLSGSESESGERSVWPNSFKLRGRM